MGSAEPEVLSFPQGGEQEGHTGLPVCYLHCHLLQENCLLAILSSLASGASWEPRCRRGREVGAQAPSLSEAERAFPGGCPLTALTCPIDPKTETEAQRLIYGP